MTDMITYLRRYLADPESVNINYNSSVVRVNVNEDEMSNEELRALVNQLRSELNGNSL